MAEITEKEKKIVYVLITDWSYDYERDINVEVFEKEEDAKKKLRIEYERFFKQLRCSPDSKWSDYEIVEDGTFAHICVVDDWIANRNVWNILKKEVL